VKPVIFFGRPNQMISAFGDDVERMTGGVFTVSGVDCKSISINIAANDAANPDLPALRAPGVVATLMNDLRAGALVTAACDFAYQRP
jgi:hypothetical protein